jgi:tRNA A37 N6-isopentenylltransferase MiaA
MGTTVMVVRFLLRVERKHLERRIGQRFDAALSRKLDAVIAAEQALRGWRR